MSGKVTKRRLGDKRKGKTDWAWVDATTEAQLERNIAADPDATIADPDWTHARLVMPQTKGIRPSADRS